mmetsp:Transcript_2163/g.6467  ORF Transcript_2163/g.6467 Transcript_2163/m.6467 type:complete len:298 (+) Transcript_2163:1944-2837(+)
MMRVHEQLNGRLVRINHRHHVPEGLLVLRAEVHRPDAAEEVRGDALLLGRALGKHPLQQAVEAFDGRAERAETSQVSLGLRVVLSEGQLDGLVKGRRKLDAVRLGELRGAQRHWPAVLGQVIQQLQPFEGLLAAVQSVRREQDALLGVRLQLVGGHERGVALPFAGALVAHPLLLLLQVGACRAVPRDPAADHERPRVLLRGVLRIVRTGRRRRLAAQLGELVVHVAEGSALVLLPPEEAQGGRDGQDRLRRGPGVGPPMVHDEVLQGFVQQLATRGGRRACQRDESQQELPRSSGT